MTEEKSKPQSPAVEFEYQLDEPPRKVWRALSIPEFRQTWLPREALADPAAVAVRDGEEVRYRMRDSAPPFLESTVIFRIAGNATGGTCLRITHELTDPRFVPAARPAANDNRALMIAA